MFLKIGKRYINLLSVEYIYINEKEKCIDFELSKVDVVTVDAEEFEKVRFFLSKLNPNQGFYDADAFYEKKPEIEALEKEQEERLAEAKRQMAATQPPPPDVDEDALIRGAFEKAGIDAPSPQMLAIAKEKLREQHAMAVPNPGVKVIPFRR